jgi:hypothetical protein
MAYPEDNFKGARGFLDTGKRGPGGRKPKLLNKWLKECNVERADAVKLLKSVLFTMTVEDLDQLIADKKDRVCVATYVLAKAAVEASKKGNYGTIRDMLEFLYGKNTQTLEVTAGPSSVVILPPKEKIDDEGMGAPAETGGGAALDSL